jgi:hypothetical protein
MFGTVARFRIKPGMESKLDEVMKVYEGDRPPGAIDSWVYRTDEDPRTYYLAVLFENRESYVKNAESPEQDKRYRVLRDLLESDPEWHDGEVIYRLGQQPDTSRGRMAA